MVKFRWSEKKNEILKTKQEMKKFTKSHLKYLKWEKQICNSTNLELGPNLAPNLYNMAYILYLYI
jgi:hypothetical protein